MKVLLIALLVAATPATSRGHIYLLTDSRAVMSMGHAHAPPEPRADHFAAQSPSGPFSNFSGNVNSNASSYSVGSGPFDLDVSAYSSAQASQTSTLSSNGFTASAFVLAQTWSDLPTWGGDCSAFASSSLLVTFTAPDAAFYELTCHGLFNQHSFPFLNAACSLASEEEGLMLHLTRSEMTSGETFTGVLSAGNTYTLTFLLEASASIPDPLGQYGSIAASMNFVIVPEPSATALLFLGFMAWIVHTRRMDPNRARQG